MTRMAGRIALISLLVLVVDFLTLENSLVTSGPALQTAGALILVLAVAGLISALILAITGRRSDLKPGLRPQQGGPVGKAVRTPFQSRRFRPFKVLVGLVILGLWLVLLPFLVHKNLIVAAPDYAPGPWVVEVFLSLFALGVQCLAPTPVAITFWPSAGIATYFLLGRKDRPALDSLLGMAAVALAFVSLRYLAPW